MPGMSQKPIDGQYQECPACGYNKTGEIVYSEDPCVVGVGAPPEWLCTRDVSSERMPHLRLRCGRCGYGWIERVLWERERP